MKSELQGSGRDGGLRCLPPAVLAATTSGSLALRRSLRDLRRRADGTRVTIETAERHAQMLRRSEQGLAAAARALSSGADVRAQICEAARASTRAGFALLREPNGDGLVQTAGVGADLPPLPLDPREEPSGAAHAFTTRRRLIVPRATGEPRVSPRLVASSGAGSLLFEPALRDNEPIGVLVVGWQEPTRDLPSWPLSTLRLLAAQAAIGIEGARLKAELEAAARSDPLTGLPNRRVWAERFPLELARAARLGQPITVALLDLDRFKRFNDEHGHQAGDRLLADAAGAWSRQLRSTDLLCRYGGEEFAVLLPDTTLEQAHRGIERLRRATPWGQTCSAGLAEWDGVEYGDALLARADRALYGAKRSGRDRTHPPATP